MLHLDYRDPRPIYEQIRQEFMRLILSGAIAPGEKLPFSAPTASLKRPATSSVSPARVRLPPSQAPCRRRKSRSSSRRSAPLPGRLSCSARRETSCSRSWTQRRKKHD